MNYRGILNAGSIAGLISYVAFLVMYYLLGVNPIGPGKMLTFLVVGGLMFYAIRNHMDVELEGFATFRQLMVPSLIFSFIYASLNGMLVYLHGAFVDAGYVELIVTDSLESLGPFKDDIVGLMGKDAYREMIEEYKKLTFSDVALSDAQSKIFSTLVLGLILSLSMRRNPPIFNQNGE